MYIKDQEAFYNEIIKLYDFAGRIIDAVECENSKDPELKAKLVAPVIEQVRKSADILAETYVEFIQKKEKPNSKYIKKIETAIRSLFNVILEFIEEVKEIPTVIDSNITKYKKNTKRKMSQILKRLVINYAFLRDGPNRTTFIKESTRLPEFSLIIDSVRALGTHCMMLGRACKTIGLVSNVDMIEPGAKSTGPSTAKTKILPQSMSTLLGYSR